MDNKVAVVILNFNNLSFLQKFLPGIVKDSGSHKIIVADNGSSDSSIEFVRTNFPTVSVIENKGNFGYADGYNRALAHVDSEYFVLVNSDVEVSPGWIEPVLKLMESDPTIGACQPKVLDFVQRNQFEYAGAAGGFIDKLGYPFCRGRIFNSIEIDEHQYDYAQEVFWATGACMFIRASAFRRCGGFDAKYFAHMEEIDLCWRLQNFGYRVFVEPGSVVYHVGGGTLNKYSSRKTFLNFRNNLTTLVKNHPGKNLLPKVLMRLVLDGIAAFKFLFEGQPKHFAAVIKGHFSFYAWLPEIFKQRKILERSPGFKYQFANIYKGFVVSEYFLEGKRKFTDLKKDFF